MSIIDIHTHPAYQRPDGSTVSVEDSVQAILEQMNRFGVEKSGLLGHTVSPGLTGAEVRAVNQYSAAMVKLSPQRLFALAFVNPALPPGEVCDELDACLEGGIFRGIKLELDVNCREATLDAVMEKSIRYQVPVLHHAWYVNTWSLDERALKHQQHRSEPHDIADLARRFPEARIIMAHLEGCGVRGIHDVAACGNVWIDTSGALPFSGTMEYALELLGSSRIVFGSDLFGRSLESQLARVNGTAMSDEARQQILHLNARDLFKL